MIYLFSFDRLLTYENRPIYEFTFRQIVVDQCIHFHAKCDNFELFFINATLFGLVLFGFVWLCVAQNTIRFKSEHKKNRQ